MGNVDSSPQANSEENFPLLVPEHDYDRNEKMVVPFDSSTKSFYTYQRNALSLVFKYCKVLCFSVQGRYHRVQSSMICLNLHVTGSVTMFKRVQDEFSMLLPINTLLHSEYKVILLFYFPLQPMK